MIPSLGYETESKNARGSRWHDRVLWAATNGRHFLRTHNGFVGIVPETIQEGDIIVILRGGPVERPTSYDPT